MRKGSYTHSPLHSAGEDTQLACGTGGSQTWQLAQLAFLHKATLLLLWDEGKKGKQHRKITNASARQASLKEPTVSLFSRVWFFATPWSVASVCGIFQARILEWVAIPFSMGSSDSGIEVGSPILQADSLPSEPPGKPQEKPQIVVERERGWKEKKNTSTPGVMAAVWGRTQGLPQHHPRAHLLRLTPLHPPRPRSLSLQPTLESSVRTLCGPTLQERPQGK